MDFLLSYIIKNEPVKPQNIKEENITVKANDPPKEKPYFYISTAEELEWLLRFWL